MENTSNKEECGASEEVKYQPEKDPSYGWPCISECEVISEGDGESSDVKFKSCQKNPGHPRFIPVLDFKKEHLFEGYQTDEMMKKIKVWSDKTVKLTIKYTSLNRPDTYPNGESSYPYRLYKGSRRFTRFGTGHITDTLQKFNFFWSKSPCPCHLCRDSQNPEIGYLEVDVSTAAHVVFDSEEAKETVVELFYDNPNNKDGVKKLYGYRLKIDSHEDNFKRMKAHRDGVRIKCATHDKEVMKLLPPMDHTTLALTTLRVGASSGIIISHPHGCSKHITVGNFLQQNYPLDHDYQDCSPFEIGSGTKFRFTENCTELRMKSFQRYARSCISFQPNKEYVLMMMMMVTLPPKSTYIFQSKNRYMPWITFPKGTKLNLPGQEHPFIILPDMMEFNLKETRNTIYPVKYVDCPIVFNHEEPVYITYDIDTCPGSSGAPVMYSCDGRFWTSHFGALPDGTNRSNVFSHVFNDDYSWQQDHRFGNPVHGCPSQ